MNGFIATDPDGTRFYHATAPIRAGGRWVPTSDSGSVKMQEEDIPLSLRSQTFDDEPEPCHMEIFRNKTLNERI